MNRLFTEDSITQRYLRGRPNTGRAKSWLGRMVNIKTENGVWRKGGGYTNIGQDDAEVFKFEDAVSMTAHCGPEKDVTFIRYRLPEVPAEKMQAMTIAGIIKFWSENETWRKVDGFPYEVSSFGNMRRQGRLENLVFGYNLGYPIVTFSLENKKTTVRIHKHVALAFYGPPPFEGAIVAHGDGDGSNCRVDNLRWASHMENRRDMVRHDTQVHGSKSNFAKLSEEDIPKIRDMVNQGIDRKVIAEKFGVHKDTIWQISKNKIWKRVNGAAWGKKNVK